MKKKGIIITSLIAIGILLITFIGITKTTLQESYASDCITECIYCEGTGKISCAAEEYEYYDNQIGWRCEYCPTQYAYWTCLTCNETVCYDCHDNGHAYDCIECDGDGKKERSAHAYTTLESVSASCETGGYKLQECVYCHETKEIEIQATGHSYGEWIDTGDGTNHTRTCTNTGCSETETEAHTIVTDERIEPTCTGTGLTEGSHCSVCSVTIDAQETIEATGHSTGDWSDAEDGQNHKKVCTVCGEVIETQAHSYGDWVDAGNGNHTRTCTECDYMDTEAHTIENEECTKCGYTEEHTHSYTEKVVAPTCEEQGYTEHTCGCGHTYKDTYTEALGHEVTNWADAGNGQHSGRCTKCYQTVREAHTEVTDAGKAATCTETGLTEGKHCSVCQVVTVEQTEIPATGHNVTNWTDAGNGKHGGRCTKCYQTVREAHTEVTDAGKAATCTTTGLTEGKHCSVCQVVTVEQTEIPATGHNVTNWADAGNGQHSGRCTKCYQTVREAHTEVTDAGKAATCTETGLTEGKHCSVCQAVTVEQTEIPATGHNVTNWADAGNGQHSGRCTKCYQTVREAHTEVTDAGKAATCTTTGLTEGSHCSKCNAIIVAQTEIQALGHEVTKWTDTGDGINHSGTCTREDCGETVEEEHTIENEECTKCEYTEEHTHSYTEKVVDPTCEEQGYTEYTCGCGHTYKDTYTEALGHNVMSWTDAGNGTHSGWCMRCYSNVSEEHKEVVDARVEATCEETGLTEGSHCSKCNAIIVAQTEIQALGHEVTKWTDTGDGINHSGTCTREGCGETVTEEHTMENETCTKCGYTEEHTHSYTETVVDPTCEEQGYTEYTCGCGHTYKDTYTEALGHEVTNWTDTGDGINHSGTCTREGCGETVEEEHTIENEKCTKCEYTEEHTHSYTETVVDPTCEEQGYTEYTCGCGHTYKDTYTEALGHNVMSWTDAGNGTHSGWCMRCYSNVSEAHTEEIDARVEATCEETGLTEGSHCSKCNAIIVAQTEIQALGHEVTKWTDTGDGINHSGTCTREDCGETVTEEHTMENETCTKCGYTEEHTHSYTETVVDPTCEEQGYTEYTCGCGHTYRDTYTDALGHDMSEATCTEAAKCQREGCDYTEGEALGHDMSEATCTEASKCQREGCDYTEGTALGHDWQEYEEPATCRESGEQGEECTRCGEKQNEATIPALGHNVTNWTDKGDGTHTGTCDRCGEEQTESHRYENGECKCGASEECKHNNVTDKKDETYHWKECEDCGAIIDKEQHRYEDGKCECGKECEHKNVTEKKDNTYHWKECNDCGAVIEKEAHTYEEGKCECGAEEPEKECEHKDKTTKHDSTYHWKECEDCGEEIEGTREKHTYEDGKCECGATEPKKECEHKNMVDKKDETYHWKECEDCGYKTDKEKHEYENGKCECGKEEDKKECTHENREWKSDGKEHWQVCKDCGKEIEGTREKHTYEDGKCKNCGLKDNTGSTTKLPDTGTATIITVGIALVILAAVGAIKLKTYKDI